MNNKKKLSLNIVELFSLWWISIAFFSLISVILGVFHPVASLSFAILMALIWVVKITRKKVAVEKLPRFFYFVLGFFIFFALFLSVNTTPTIFGGRDEGTYSNTGILMAKNHSLAYESELAEEFFEIYGEGRALNFPGFQYTSGGELKSQFLPAYPAWLANFYGLFGVKGFKFANFFPFLTLILSFYLILSRLLLTNKTFEESLENNQADSKKSKNNLSRLLKKISLNEKLSFLGAAVLATCFPIAVFYKFTLSEIFFASLIWFVLHMAFKYFQTKNFHIYQLMFLPLVLTAFVRVEAAAFIFLLLLIMILKDFNHLRQAKYQFFFVIAGIALFTSVSVMPNFFINTIKSAAEVSLTETAPSEISTNENLLPDDWQNFYLLKVLYNYNLAPLFLMAIFAVIFIVKKRRFLKEKEDKKFNSLLLLPLIFCAPTFIYLIDANISLDHPWMLRRFVFTIIPVFVLYSMLFLKHIAFRNKILFNLISVFALMGNIVLLIPADTAGKQTSNNFLAFRQNKDLFEKTKILAQNFTADDLILVSQKSSGSGWSLMSEPMRSVLDLQAVYFFNPNDLEELDLDDYENVYLISSEQENSLYEDIEKKKIKEYELKNSIIQPSKKPLKKPKIKETAIKAEVYKLQSIENYD